MEVEAAEPSFSAGLAAAASEAEDEGKAADSSLAAEATSLAEEDASEDADHSYTAEAPRLRADAPIVRAEASEASQASPVHRRNMKWAVVRDCGMHRASGSHGLQSRQRVPRLRQLGGTCRSG